MVMISLYIFMSDSNLAVLFRNGVVSFKLNIHTFIHIDVLIK